MSNKHAGDFDKLLDGYRALKIRLIQQSAGMALAHFKQSFVNQGFTDQSLVKWKGRTAPPNGKQRAVLIQRGVLRRGLRIKSTSIDGAVVGMDDAVPYAEIHNFGGEIPITPQMRRFFWAMYFKFGGGRKRGGVRSKPSALAQYYFSLAITNKTSITIPKRQFIGDSATLDRKVFEYVSKELDTFFKIA